MNHLASRCALFESIISFASIWHLSFVRRRSRYGESPASTPAFSWARFRMGTELGEGGVHARFSFAWCCRCRRWRRADRSVTWVAPTSLVRNRPLCLRREYVYLGGAVGSAREAVTITIPLSAILHENETTCAGWRCISALASQTLS